MAGDFLYTSKKKRSLDQRNLLAEKYINLPGVAYEELKKKYASITRISREDLIQEGMMILVTSAEDWNEDSGSTFVNYALFNIKNRMKQVASESGVIKRPWYIEWAKKQKINDDILDKYKAASHLSPTLEEVLPAKRKAVVENRDLVNQALKKLKPREKQIIRMMYWNNYSQKEIAQKLGTTNTKICIEHKNIIKKIKTMVA